VSSAWPAAVRAKEFFELHRLARTSPGVRLQVDVVDGMLVFDASALAEMELARLQRLRVVAGG
jgi:hypothetical protein